MIVPAIILVVVMMRMIITVLIVATTIGQWRFVARDEIAIDAFIASIVTEL